MQSIADLGFFESEIINLRKTSFFTIQDDPVNISNAEYSTIHSLLNTIRYKSGLLIEALDKIFATLVLPENSISIKIPYISTFDELIQYATTFKKIIELPLAEYKEGGQVKITNFDSGTFWIDILLPSAGSVTLLGSIAWAGAVIYKKYQEALLLNLMPKLSKFKQNI